MTMIAALITACGLSQSEAANLLNVRRDTVKSWSAGRRTVPVGVTRQLAQLYVDVLDAIARQDRETQWPTHGVEAVVHAGISARELVAADEDGVDI